MSVFSSFSLRCEILRMILLFCVSHAAKYTAAVDTTKNNYCCKLVLLPVGRLSGITPDIIMCVSFVLFVLFFSDYRAYWLLYVVGST